MIQLELPIARSMPPIAWKRYPIHGFHVAHYELLRYGVPNGAWVRHCCHPTAIRPYFVVLPDRSVLDRKFSHAADAKAALLRALNYSERG